MTANAAAADLAAGSTGETSWTPELADYIAAMRAHYRYWLRSRRQVISMGLWWGGLTVAWAAFGTWVYHNYEWSTETTALLLVTPLVWAAVIVVQIPIRYYLVLPRHCRRVLRQDRTAFEPRRDRWSDAGFERTGPSSTRLVPWGDFYASREIRSTFALYFNEQSYWILPKRALTAEQASQLSGYLAGIGRSRR